MTFKINSFLATIALVASFSTPALAVSVPSESVVYTVGGPVATGTTVNLNVFQADRADRYRTLDTAAGDINLYDAALVRTTNYDALFSSRKPDGLKPNDKYLAVFGYIEHWQPGAAVFELNGNYNTFSFTWGSVDWYNAITIVDKKGDSYTLTGEQLLNTTSSLIPSETTTYFSITDLNGIARVIITSAFDAFEMANITVSNVPLPAALPLFGMAIAGLAVARRRKAARAA